MDINIRQVSKLHPNIITEDDCVFSMSHSPFSKNKESLPSVVSIMALYRATTSQISLTFLHNPYTLHSVVTFHFLACPTYSSLQCTVSLLPLAHYSDHLSCIITSIFPGSLLLTTLMTAVTHFYETQVPTYQSMQICMKSMTGIISTALRKPQISCKVV